MELNEKQALQEAEYDIPFHWNLPGAEGLKYECLSQLIADLIASIGEVAETGSVTFVDLGCGDGASTTQVTRFLRGKGIAVQTYGFDYSERAITQAREKTASMDGAPIFSVQPIETLPSVPSDQGPVAILLREVIEHLTEEQIDETMEKLKASCPTFHLILTTPSVNSPVEPKHYRHYDEAMISDVVSRNHLSMVRLTGFSLRPRFLLSLLSKIKSVATYRPALAPLTRPLWRTYPPQWSQTLVAMAHFKKGD